MTLFAQRSFSSGEISPSLGARVDQSKYQSGCSIVRNFLVMRHGGAQNRPGTSYVGHVKYSTSQAEGADETNPTTRLIPFDSGTVSAYMLEFGYQLIRFIKNGAHVLEAAKTISGITKANPGVVTAAAHGFSNGDEVVFSVISGMSELSETSAIVASVTTNTFSLKDHAGNNISTSSYGTFTSGTVSRVYQLASPYHDYDLSELQYVQSLDIMTIAHPSFPPYELKHLSNSDTDWSMTATAIGPGIAAPTGLTTTGPSAAGDDTDAHWVVTTVAEDTFEESYASSDIDAATRAPGNVTNAICSSQTVPAGNLTLDGTQAIAGVWTNGYGRKVGVTSSSNLSSLTFTIIGEDAAGAPLTEIIIGPNNNTMYGDQYFAKVTTVYSNGGSVNSASVGVGAMNIFPVTISWTAVTGAQEYNVYRKKNGVYGFVGIAGTNSFLDTGTEPDTLTTPPIETDLFNSEDNYPSAVAFFQQRLAFANTNAEPEKVWMSKTGNFHNFSISSPLQDDDAVIFNLVGSKLNRVKHLLDANIPLTFTSSGEYVLQGDSSGIIKPGQINPKQQTYNGSGDLAPLTVGGNVLYIQARNSIVRDLGFDYQVDGYRGNDLTVFSSHLVDGYTFVAWAYQQTPQSIVWMARSDGALIGMTYVREQQVIAWHRHDVDGEVESLAVISEGEEDALYLVVKRTIDGDTYRYVERLNSRQLSDVVDSVFLDSAISYDGRNTGTRTMTLSGGTTWAYTETLTLTASTSFFQAGDVGNEIHLTVDDDIIRFTITGYTGATVVTGRAHKTVPAAFRSTALTTWSKAVKTLYGLRHLEGKAVSVLGDGFVVASVNNSAYGSVTVSNGSITLSKAYSVIHVGLPITADLQTLDLDTLQAETMADKSKLVTRVTVWLEDSRGLWVGGSEPDGDDPLDGLNELKIRNEEGYDDPVELKTGTKTILIPPQWKSNGRVFLRQVDPVPVSVLAVGTGGLIPVRSGG